MSVGRWEVEACFGKGAPEQSGQSEVRHLLPHNGKYDVSRAMGTVVSDLRGVGRGVTCLRAMVLVLWHFSLHLAFYY